MKIVIAGDFCPQDRVARLIENNKYESVLVNVKNVVAEADYRIVNLECPVCNGGEKPIVKLGPNLCCSEKGIEAIKWAGFDCVTLANNHFYDYGDAGVKNTINMCMSAGIDTVGGGMNIREASSILYKNIGKETLAIVNCCEHEFSIATERSGGSNPMIPVQQYYAIKQARNNAKYVLVIVHGGHEHWQLPSVRMQETYRFFIDAGADAVVNHHQHCYSGYEVYNNKPIFYGLGNFCFDRNTKRNDIWNYGYLIFLTFEKSEISFEIAPYKQCSEEPKVVFFSKSEISTQLEELNDIISDTEKLRKKNNEYYYKCQGQIESVLEPFKGRIFDALKRRKLLPSFLSDNWKVRLYNYTICESHRDKVKYYLEKLIKHYEQIVKSH